MFLYGALDEKGAVTFTSRHTLLLKRDRVTSAEQRPLWPQLVIMGQIILCVLKWP